MLDKLKSTLYFNQLNLLMKKGIANGSIQPFENEVWNTLENKTHAGIPAIIELKHMRPLVPPGRCWDRSYTISMAFDDCDLVRGNTKDLKLQHGKDSAWHFWVEHKDWCYEPWNLLKFKKELYYKMFQPTNISRRSRKELEQDKFYQQSLNGHYEKALLVCTIPLLESIARQKNDADFISEVEKFKIKANYNTQTEMGKVNNNDYCQQ